MQNQKFKSLHSHTYFLNYVKSETYFDFQTSTSKGVADLSPPPFGRIVLNFELVSLNVCRISGNWIPFPRIAPRLTDINFTLFAVRLTLNLLKRSAKGILNPVKEVGF